MAVATQTFLALKKLMWEACNDYLTFATTTNITTNNSVISTTLNIYDDGVDDYFNGWWIYIDGVTNPNTTRKITNYATSGGTITVSGAALVAETAARTCYLCRVNPEDHGRAIQRAMEEIYPTLHLPLENQTLITGNILPDASFEDWPTTATLTWYTASNTTLLKTSTAGKVKNGTYSVSSTTTAANGNFYISSNSYPRLLDLMGQSVSLYVWAYPETLDDPTVIIDTVSTDGTTTQTLTSTTSCPAGYWTLIKLEDQALNDDLQEVKITFNVATSGQYCFFDDANLQGRNIKEYLLPTNFRDGHLSEARIQGASSQEPACYDFNTFATMSKGDILTHTLIDEGAWRYLRLDDSFTNNKRLRLLGRKPLETLSADTDTITLNAEKIPLLIAKAKMIFYERQGKPVSAEDISRYNFEMSRATNEYYTKKSQMGMMRAPENLRSRNIG